MDPQLMDAETTSVHGKRSRSGQLHSHAVQTFRLEEHGYLPVVLERLILQFLDFGDLGSLLQATQAFRCLTTTFLQYHCVDLVCRFSHSQASACLHALKVARSTNRLRSVAFENWPALAQSSLEDWLLDALPRNSKHFVSFTPSRWWPTSMKIVRALDQCENLTALSIYPEEDDDNFLFNVDLLRFLAERCMSPHVVVLMVLD